MPRLGEKLRQLLFEPVDIAALVAYRAIFGLLMAYDSLRYVAAGWVTSHYVEPGFNYKYYGFEWVEPLSAAGMHAVFGVMIAAGLCMALGLFYRLSALLFFLGHTYVFLLAAEYYLNHAYLISIVALLMVFVPAHRAASLDLRRRPELYTQKIHAWAYWLPIGLIWVVYTYGAIAKMNPDWLAGEPVRHWIGYRAEEAIEPIATFLTSEAGVIFVAYGGLLFDLLVVPALLWRKTRWLAVAISLGFHLSNHYLFNIGVFPWFMIGSTTLFLGWSWPRKVPLYGARIDRWITEQEAPEAEDAPSDPLAPNPRRDRLVMAGVSVFFALMIAVPLRHHLYPSEVAWTEEGHNFSWRMKLRSKKGRWSLVVTDEKTGESWRIDPSDQLTDRQVRKATGRPDLLLQYAHHLRDAYRHHMGMEVEIRADTSVSLNYRDPRPLIDPTVDLAEVEPSLMPYDWLTAFEDTPLPSPVPRARRRLGPIAASVGRRLDGDDTVGRLQMPINRLPSIGDADTEPTER